ncbi:hypothetical protein FRC11_011457 [Ceratobasidium sp. 423]|nr:hypothetical protein FRC11_011457 [Ceratobasidium sp. 423]
MGRRLAYPDVPSPKIHEIYKQSLHKPIHAFGFYVDLAELYDKKRGPLGSLNLSIPIADDVGVLLQEVRSELVAAGLHKLSIAWIPIPKQRRTIYSGDEAWLVILGTGFDKTPHVPISDELTQCVRDILKTEEPPSWWSMTLFTYPPPKRRPTRLETRIVRTQ